MEPTQDELLTYIDAAITFYERVAGKVPTAKRLHTLLLLANVQVDLERIKTNLETVLHDEPFHQPSDETEAERYNREMDARNRIAAENREKPWLPLVDGE